MKCSKKVKAAFLTIGAAILATKSVFAADIKSIDTEGQCKTIASEILKVLESNETIDGDCQADVLASSVYLKSAGQGIKNRQYQRAVVYLLRSEELLQIMQLSKERCAYFAPILKPYIPKVQALKMSIDALEG